MHVHVSGTLCHHIQTDLCSTVPILPIALPPSKPWYHSYLNFKTVNFISIFISAYVFKFNFRIQEDMLMIADISVLYVVQISWLWGSSSLQHNHCFSSYTGLPSAARTWDFCSKLHTVTDCYTYCPGKIITGSNKHINNIERERKCLPPMQVSLHPTHSLANKEMKA
jgi:hypothetical protein